MNSDTVENYLLRMEIPNEQLDEATWVLAPESLRDSRIIMKVSAPIVLFSAPLFTLNASSTGREALFRRLLEFNEELLHCSYGLQGDQVVLSGAQQLENLDYNEFQAMIDDMSMSLDRHLGELAPWRPALPQEGA